MKTARLLVASLLSLAASSLAAFAQPVAFKIDPAHSEVAFSIRHFFSRVPGRFNDFSGVILFDEKNPANSSVEVTIQAASIYTANDRRDAHLKSADFFATDSFPTITFKSTKVTAQQAAKAAASPTSAEWSVVPLKVEGDFTVRGITRPITLQVNFLGKGDIAIEGRTMGSRAGWEASTTLNRKDYGIVWNKTLDHGGTMLGDEVAVTLGIEAVKVEPAEAGAGAAPTKK